MLRRLAPPRGLNKRPRAPDDDAGDHGSGGDMDFEHDKENSYDRSAEGKPESAPPMPSTPKRARIAPETLPLGLERADYHGLLHSNADPDTEATDGTDTVLEADGEPWSTEEDRILVELVLEKLKLTKSDWQDCARSLGKGRSSVGRRWKSLMACGDVGIKRSSRRSRIHSTWR